MNAIGDIMGDLCKVVFPIPEEFYVGSAGSHTAICTLSSIGLLRQIARSEIMKHVALAGRLFSENRGIDSLVRYVYLHKNIRTILVCGREVSGHRAGHSLMKLYKNGTDKNNRIVGSESPKPFLTVGAPEIDYFQNHITLVDQIGTTNISVIRRLVQ